VTRIVDTTLRLLSQPPLVGTLSTARVLEVAEILDGAGFGALEVTGGGCFEAAVNRGSESLMVVTASAKHAERVRAAVEAAFAGRSDVADFVSRDTAEPLAVLTLEESVAESRDRVIFSLGFGLTKHGRVLSDFGDLSTPDGERLLTVGMTRARRSMVIVSSIRPCPIQP